jgi:branched-chain amino acid transport system substrate-binding protein
MRIRTFVVLAAVASVAACSQTAGPGSTPGVRVVVLQDGSLPDAADLVSPGVLGLRLALSQAPSTELEILDTAGDPARTIAAARAAAADPGVVAAVIAPFTALPPDALDVLLGAGLPVLTLSSLSEPPAGKGPPPAWRRFVAPVSVTARAELLVAANIHRADPVCVLGEDTIWSTTVRTAIDRTRTGVRVRSITPPPGESLAAIEAAGCGAAMWTGGAPGAGALADAIHGNVPLVLDDAARTTGYLVGRWPTASTALAVCSCADVSTSEDPDAQRFVHDLQASTGLDAGPFAVEGFDAGTWLVRALGEGATREQVADRLASLTRFDGLTRTYRWDDRGSPLDQGVRVYRGVGLRWLPAGPVPASPRARRRASR